MKLSFDFYISETSFYEETHSNSISVLHVSLITFFIYRVGNDLRPPLHSLNYKRLRKSMHMASKYHQCGTPVPNFMDLS